MVAPLSLVSKERGATTPLSKEKQMGSRDFTPWPCLELSRYPLDKHWTDTFPQENLSKYHYTHILNAERSFFMSPSMAETYAQLRNYAFHQGAFSNANPMDLEFFYSMLSHDYPFFIGDKGNEIQTAFQMDTSKFRGLGHLKSSHYDLFRVERTALGLAELQSLTNPGKMNAFISFFNAPKKDDIIFARLMPIGILPRSFAYSVVEPWDTVDPEYADSIVSAWQKQYQAYCDKFPGTTARAFTKISAYHLYELIQAHELRPILNEKLSAVKDTLYSQTISYKFTDKKSMIKLQEIPGNRAVKGQNGNVPDLVTVAICQDKSIPQTLREAIVSKDGRTLEITMFMHDAAQSFIENTIKPLLENRKYIEDIHVFDDNEMYRALRHLSI